MYLTGIHLMGVHSIGVNLASRYLKVVHLLRTSHRWASYDVQLSGRNCSPAEIAVKLAALIFPPVATALFPSSTVKADLV